jgi:hypothetical protein
MQKVFKNIYLHKNIFKLFFNIFLFLISAH